MTKVYFIETPEVVMPLLKSIRKRLFTIILTLIVITFSVGWLSNGNEEVIQIVSTIWCGCFCFALLSEKYKVVGEVSLFTDKIIAEKKGIGVYYPIEHLEHLKVHIVNVRARFAKGTVFFPGNKNYIAFELNGAKHKLRFRLHEEHIIMLSVVLQMWKKEGVEFDYYNDTNVKFI